MLFKGTRYTIIQTNFTTTIYDLFITITWVWSECYFRQGLEHGSLGCSNRARKHKWAFWEYYISGHFDSSKIANRRYRKQEKIDDRGKEHSSSSFSGLFWATVEEGLPVRDGVSKRSVPSRVRFQRCTVTCWISLEGLWETYIGAASSRWACNSKYFKKINLVDTYIDLIEKIKIFMIWCTTRRLLLTLK